MTAGRATLSAIIPNHNHGQYIGRAVDALLTQERVPDEIVIVDDASTDDSLAIINELAAKSPRIKVVSLSVNAGTNAALRAGLEIAQPVDYFVLAGADDWVMPGFCELGMRMLTQNPSRLACSAAIPSLSMARPGKRWAIGRRPGRSIARAS